jgi:hypothetical protein
MLASSVVGLAERDTGNAARDGACRVVSNTHGARLGGPTGINGIKTSEEAGVPWSGIWSSGCSDEAMVCERVVESLHPVVDIVLINDAAMGRSIRGLSHLK